MIYYTLFLQNRCVHFFFYTEDWRIPAGNDYWEFAVCSNTPFGRYFRARDPCDANAAANAIAGNATLQFASGSVLYYRRKWSCSFAFQNQLRGICAQQFDQLTRLSDRPFLTFLALLAPEFHPIVQKTFSRVPYHPTVLFPTARTCTQMFRNADSIV